MPDPSDTYQLSDRYQLASWPPTQITRDLWNAVLGSIADRLTARETLEASFELLQSQGVQASLDYIQATVAPQIAQLQTSVATVQDVINQIINDGISPDAGKLGGQVPSYYATVAGLNDFAKVTNLAIAEKVASTRTVAGKPLSDDVILAKSDVGLGEVDNTSDKDKPISDAQASAINGLKTAVDGKLAKTGGSITGGLSMSGGLTIANASPTITMQDTDNGTRSVHCNAGTIGFLNNAGNWALRVADSGDIWSPLYNDWLSNVLIVHSGDEARGWTNGARLHFDTGHSYGFHWNSGFYYNIDNNAWVLVNSSPSDANFKNLLPTSEDTFAQVLALNPVRYVAKDGIPVAIPEGERSGFLAQELEKIDPSLIVVRPIPGAAENGEEKTYYSLADDAPIQLIAKLTRAVQVLASRVEALEAR
jgi:hypothetical protein